MVSTIQKFLPMTFERLWEMGYRHLIPVVPPGVDLSPTSGLYKRLAAGDDSRGKVPGVQLDNGLWTGLKDWSETKATHGDIQRWHRMQANAGVMTGHDGVIMVDADTLDPVRARLIKAKVLEILGKSPIRIGQSPKAGYIMRTTDPAMAYRCITFGEHGEKPERVEVQTMGKQFVASGIHPRTGEPYFWDEPLVPLHELPLVTPEQIDRLLLELRPLLPQASELKREAGTSPVDQAALKGNLEKVRQAVQAMPNDKQFGKREDYLDVGYAIKASLPDHPAEAFEIFSDWCSRWTEAVNEPAIVEQDWKRMTGALRRGADWLYGRAEETSGGAFVAASAFFDVITDEEIDLFATAPQAVDVFPSFTFEEIEERAPPTWLIHRYLPEQGTGFIYAAPNVGKTFLALDMALAISCRWPDWFGDPITVPEDGGLVVYIAGEGSWGLRNRLKAWRKIRGNGDAPQDFIVIDQAVNMRSPDAIMKLIRTIDARVAGRRMLALFIDTVSRSIPGGDENLQKDMSTFVQAMDYLKATYGCCVVAVHHAGKNGDMRGSTVLNGAGDFVFKMTRKEKATVTTVFCEKHKDFDRDWEDHYAMDKIALEDGQTSLVMRRLEKYLAADPVAPGLQESILGALQSAFDAKQPWTAHPRSRARYAVTHMVKLFGMKADEAEAFLAMLLATGQVKEVIDGHTKRAGLCTVPDIIATMANVDTEADVDGEPDGTPDGVPDAELSRFFSRIDDDAPHHATRPSLFD